MRSLAMALAFLTRVPVRTAPGPPGRALHWFPLVGAAIGGLGGAVYVAGRLALPPLVAAAFAVASTALITGALHEDGLADVADAAGGRDRTRRLAILDDPRHGTFGVLAIVVLVIIRVSSLGELAGWDAMAASVAAHSLGRSAAAGLLPVLPAAKPGLAAGTAAGASAGRAFVAVLLGVAITLAALRWAGGAAVVATAASTLAIGLWARRALGGVTGDVLGAVEQTAEAGVLVAAAALL